MRLIHAVRELNEQRRDPIVLIALFTDVERHAMFVREADEAVCLGPSTGGTHRSGYLDQGALEEALVAARADAAWVGWGFVAEDPDFADLCERLGIVFVGPDPAVMRLVGDKIAAKRLAEKCEIPVAPWSGGAVDTVEEALRHATRIGFPARGQGRRGRRRPRDPPRRRRGRPCRRLPVGPRRGRAGLRRRHAPAGAPGHSGPADRGAGDRGRAGHRMGDRRARLQLPAPPPEGDRGVRQPRAHRGAGCGDPGGGAASCAAGRLPQRRHGRVPLRAGRAPLLLHGGQRPASGRSTPSPRRSPGSTS